MKKLLLISCLLLASNISLAYEAENITSNDEVKACIDKYGEENSECLGEIDKKSTDALNKTYAARLKEMENFDYTEWWMGDEDRKKRMIEIFKRSHAEWLKYRDDYCNVAATGAQGTHFLGNASVGCTINMNKRRIKEIQMLQMNNLK